MLPSRVQAKGKRAKGVERVARNLNATYADLPAPRWDWEEMPAAPVPRLDGAAVQIGDLLYVFAGYGSLDHVSNSPYSLVNLALLLIMKPFLLVSLDQLFQAAQRNAC